MGAHFHIPASLLPGTSSTRSGARRRVALWAADAPALRSTRSQPPARLALVVGNEGAGLSQTRDTRIDRLVALPIASAVESLNVAVAAGILLYQLRS